MNAYALGKIAAEEDYGLAPWVGSVGKLVPVPFTGPIVAGIAAGTEADDTDSPGMRGLYAAGGHSAGSIAGTLGGALVGGGAGALAAHLGRPRWRAQREDLIRLLAAVGGTAGNFIGGHKGTEWGIKKHRESEEDDDR